MEEPNSLRFYILQKKIALKRLEGKRYLKVEDLLKDGVPAKSEYYVYVQITGLIGPADDGGRGLRCILHELSLEDDIPTGNHGELRVLDRTLTDFMRCITIPANVFVCNFQLTIDSGNHLNKFVLILDEEKGGKIALIKVVAPVKRVEDHLPANMEYTTLKDLAEAPTLSVYGVIKAIPESAERSVKFLLTDPSIDAHKHVACYLNTDNPTTLPHDARIGDVLRLHRISARIQHGEAMQLFGRMGKAGLSWLLFDGRQGADLTPISSSEKFTLKNTDLETARVLRSWYAINRDKPAPQNEAATASTPEPPAITPLDSFPLKCYRNIVVQVIGVFDSVHSTKPVILRGWDGTKCGKRTVRVDPEQEQLPTHSYDKDLDNAVGELAVDIFIYDEHREVARNLKAGQFALLVNVHFGFMKPPEYAFMVHGKNRGADYGRGVKMLEETDAMAINFKKSFDDRVSKLPDDVRARLQKQPAAELRSTTKNITPAISNQSQTRQEQDEAEDSSQSTDDGQQSPPRLLIRRKMTRINSRTVSVCTRTSTVTVISSPSMHPWASPQRDSSPSIADASTPKSTVKRPTAVSPGRNATSTPKKKPASTSRARGKADFLDEYISGLSSSSSGDESTSSEENANPKPSRRLLKLRNRSVRVSLTPSPRPGSGSRPGLRSHGSGKKTETPPKKGKK